MSKKLLLLLGLTLLSSECLAQWDDTGGPFSVGIGLKASLLGAGVEFAVPIHPRFNLRGGFNTFSYDRAFNQDGVNYAGQLRFRSAEGHLDWFPFRGAFHVGPGVLVYNGNRITAHAAVPGGDTFTLNGATYASDPANPIRGSGKIDFQKAAPLVTIGWGNLVPRNGRRFSFPFEIGAIYQDAPRVGISLNGGACDANLANCAAINSDPSFQANVTAERNKLNRDVSAFRIYPIISIGFGFRF